MNMRKLQIELMLAWRNVWKNKRRTIITLLTITVGCTMIILMNAWATGIHDQMIEDAVATNTAHIQIHEKGFWDSRSIDYAFQPDDTLIQKLKSSKKISAFSRRVHSAGLLSFGNTTQGALIQAVDPVKEKSVSTIHKKILKGGRYLKANDRHDIIIGEIVAKNLGAGIGDTVSMISQGFDGSIAAENLAIVGIFKTGNPEHDRSIIMPISQAMETFTMMGYISSIAIILKSPDYIEDFRNELRKSVDTDKLEVMGWDELMPELVQFIVMDDVSAYIFDFILFMVVAFGILNTIQMSVYERIREFGIMLAIGTRPNQVTVMVLFESMFIALIGIVFGLILGSIISYILQIYPIDMSSYAEEMSVWGVNTLIMPTKLTLLNLVVTSAVTFLLSALFSLLPARKASKLKPIEAIRHL